MFATDIDEIFSPDVAQEITLDGGLVRILPGNITSGPSEYHGEIRTSWDFTAPAVDLTGQYLPEMDVVINGLQWDVDQVTYAGDVVDFSLSRKLT
jgi:hypothetical protein